MAWYPVVGTSLGGKVIRHRELTDEARAWVEPPLPERRRRGRQPEFDREAHRRRNVVKRCVNRLKQWREGTTRHEKSAVNYRATVISASLIFWLTT